MLRRLIKSLFILLLIVGCAPKTINPPLATFYIGMTEKEFDEQNKDKFSNVLEGKDGFITKNIRVLKTQDYFEGDNPWSMNAHHYTFINDTLLYVSRGVLNHLLEKGIDYDKYATPPK